MLKGLCIVIFGDNSALKKSLLYSGNTVIKELINCVLRYGTSVGVSAVLFNSTSHYKGKLKKASLQSPLEFENFYAKLADSVG